LTSQRWWNCASGLSTRVVCRAHKSRPIRQISARGPRLWGHALDLALEASRNNADRLAHSGSKLGGRVRALGGATNEMHVLPDADLDITADASVNAGSGSAGERCMARLRSCGLPHAD
jgi:hypothetical protein